MKEIFYELIKEAKTGNIIIDDEEWPIAFNTRIVKDESEVIEIGNEENETLVINDEEEFLTLLEEYLNLEIEANRNCPKFYSEPKKSKIKFLMAYLLVNATTEEFLNPVQLLRRKISFLNDKTFAYLSDTIEVKLGTIFKNSSLAIKNEESSVSMETPNKITLTLKSEASKDAYYNLPSIYYGISEEDNEKVCYIYSLINPKDKEQPTEDREKYHKQINRLLYKMNRGIADVESEDYQAYRRGESTYYPEENISDITPSFVLALNIFTSLLQRENIEKIKVVTYLPLRYNSRYNTAVAKSDIEKKEELLKRNDNIQQNATNKLIRTFRRLAHHNKELSVVSLPYEVDEFLTMSLNSRQKELDNMLLEETNEVLNNKKLN